MPCLPGKVFDWADQRGNEHDSFGPFIRVTNSFNGLRALGLLLTAPLITGRSGVSSDLLTPVEYKRLARHLSDNQLEPKDLIAVSAEPVRAGCHFFIEYARLQRLLSCGFLLSQALEQWQSRSIWVISRADASTRTASKSACAKMHLRCFSSMLYRRKPMPGYSGRCTPVYRHSRLATSTHQPNQSFVRVHRAAETPAP